MNLKTKKEKKRYNIKKEEIEFFKDIEKNKKDSSKKNKYGKFRYGKNKK